MKLRNLKVYFDFRDWWIGYYKGDTHHYICLLPTVVIRWKRRFKSVVGIDPGMFTGINYMVQASCPPDKVYLVPNVTTDSLMEAMDRLSGYTPRTVYLHPDTKEFINKIARLDIKKSNPS